MDSLHIPFHTPKQQQQASSEAVGQLLDISQGTIVGRRPRKTIVLCFDGTGNSFNGDPSDSNILKIFRMLDRSDGAGYHYYQPGIGTYVTTSSLSSTGAWERWRDWYMQYKDAAIGTSFDEHVVGGYKFLMQYYSPGDDIYMFGFSRGSYTARFLAEMLDWMGLITYGNEEMIQFAWRTFSQWKSMNSQDPEALEKQKKAYDFMVSFRETFSRPVRRIRYLGLFDTVNSVRRFEHAMTSKVHMPYSAISSARVIRHAVSIDERRAKFRADLISEEGRRKSETDAARAKHMKEKHSHHHQWSHVTKRFKPKKRASIRVERSRPKTREPRRSARYRSHSRSHAVAVAERSVSPEGSPGIVTIDDGDESSDNDETNQVIDEVWFAGGHADIGGGWGLAEGEVPLSHLPLAWIMLGAIRSGLRFNEDKMKKLGCWEYTMEAAGRKASMPTSIPAIEVSNAPEATVGIPTQQEIDDRLSKDMRIAMQTTFKERMQRAIMGKCHDCLEYGQGTSRISVLIWRMMEWLPFRRMDLQEDGSWKPIRWPLPRGEVRDIPSNSKIHHSVIKRMQADPNYRPGNLIIGGGGVGVRVAPPEAGIGEWVVCEEEGDAIGECWKKVEKKTKPHPEVMVSSVDKKHRIVPMVLSTFLVVLIGFCWRR
ncbi:hypothetical protein HYFRA_00004978 [Hymenoscyphus fraxineus]|uniref:T6SS Phospholipase effector Tle1-like catalytic domain-containing protein n=1 Tax=Hymenoscyphus fraxineus TaxID=746836 RepID=A0A9N9KNR6_9HELO|nr:hypothetical protein HYFRA_00004978 [Hymenoscyphus fraxineus]